MQNKIIKILEHLGIQAVRHQYKYTHTEPHDNPVMAILMLENVLGN